jgi:hypothetical protein
MKGLEIKTDNVEIELQEYNSAELEDLMTKLGDSHAHAKEHVCRDLYRIFIKQEEVAFETVMKNIIELFRWCNTDDDGSYAKGKSPAIEISKLLFNGTLPILSDYQFHSEHL